ncbi:unnamed protein product [Dracunculus medinensis]|uniref:AB hydrolase-1 domain-containing protein n=1 Tax=Dracunculus medinensis TaxID=318479 RepID=A0A0N4U3J7_DRAME|nr:unnamed protein product [Dracunculus medinensis]
MLRLNLNIFKEYEIFYRNADPPLNNFAKGNVLLIHGQSFSSSTWLQHSTMEVIAAAGYRVIAIDLPGCGKTRGPAVPDEKKAEILLRTIRALELDSVIIIGHSMAGQYIIPLLGNERIRCIVAIALSNTNMVPLNAENIKTPVLIVWGDKDTSLGPTCASNLKRLPNSKLLKITSAGHACYLNDPQLFQSACLNFFDLVRHYSNC